MKKFKLISTVGIASAMILSGCGHQHTYSEEWSSNATQHWHESTCEHTGLADKLGNHVDNDNDGKCDTCGRQLSTPVVDPAITSLTIGGAVSSLAIGKTVKLTANIIAVGGAATGVTWSINNTSLATLSSTSGKEVTLTAKGEGKVTVTVTSTFDSSKTSSVEINIIDQGFDPSWIDEEGYTYSKEFPTDAIKQFLGGSGYTVVSPTNMEGGCYYKVFEETDEDYACIEVVLDGVVYEDYAYDLMDADFDRIYNTSIGTIEAVDPTGYYTIAMGSSYDEKTYEDLAPTFIAFYKSSDVWDSSELTSDITWDYEKIVNVDAEEIAQAKEWVSKIPFVSLGEDYEIEYIVDDSMREQYIETLEMYEIIDETTTEEELEYYLELLGYTGPEMYLQIYDYSICKPFETYDDVLLNAGFAHIEYEDEYGDSYDYYELNDGLVSYDLSFGFTEMGNTIYFEQGVAILEAFPIAEANAFISNVLGSENSIVAYEETEGASFQAVIGDEEMDIICDYVDISEAQAYANKLEGLGFEVEYTPADDYYYPVWVATKGKLVVEFYLEQIEDEDTEEYLDEGPLYFLIYADPNKHEAQGIYLPETVATNLNVGSVELEPEMVKLGDSVNLTWSSSNEEIATVDSYGLVTFKAAGEVDITVTTDVAIPEVGGFYSATTKLTIAEKPDFTPVLAELNETLKDYGGTEVLSTTNLPEIDCAEYETSDLFLFYGCYAIWGNATNETEASYIEKVEGLGFEVLEDEYGKYYETEQYQIAFSYIEDEEEGDYFQVCVYFKEVESKGVTFDFTEITTTSGSSEGFSFTTSKASGQADPAYNTKDEELRLYANNTITFTSEEAMTSIYFDCNTMSATFAASTGTVTKGDGYFYWEGNATQVTFTVGSTGRVCVSSIDINGGGEGGGGGQQSSDFEALLDKIELVYSATLSYDSEDDSYFSEEAVCSSSSKTMMQVVTEAVSKLPDEFSEEYYAPYEDFWDEEETDPGVFACYLTKDWSVVIEINAWTEDGQIYLQIVVYEI